MKTFLGRKKCHILRSFWQQLCSHMYFWFDDNKYSKVSDFEIMPRTSGFNIFHSFFLVHTSIQQPGEKAWGIFPRPENCRPRGTVSDQLRVATRLSSLPPPYSSVSSSFSCQEFYNQETMSSLDVVWDQGGHLGWSIIFCKIKSTLTAIWHLTVHPIYF